MCLRVQLLPICAIALAAISAACASGAANRPSPFPTAPVPASAATSSDATALRPPDVELVLDTALGLRGTPYRMGGESPTRGFDCSGFVQYVFAQHHIDLPRTVAEQYRVGAKISREHVRAGDLVFFSTVAPGASHIGIATGPTDEFIHAPSEKGVVRVEHLNTAYWRDRFVGARRLPAHLSQQHGLTLQ